MCTNYRAPGEEPGIGELRIGLTDLRRRKPWEPEIRPDYAAAIVRAVGDRAEAVIANYGIRKRGDGAHTISAKSRRIPDCGICKLVVESIMPGPDCV